MKDRSFEKIMDEILKYYQKIFNQNTDLTFGNIIVYYNNTPINNIEPSNKPTPLEYKYFNMTMEDIDNLFESGTDDEIRELIDIIVKYETTVDDQIKVLLWSNQYNKYKDIIYKQSAIRLKIKKSPYSAYNLSDDENIKRIRKKDELSEKKEKEIKLKEEFEKLLIDLDNK